MKRRKLISFHEEAERVDLLDLSTLLYNVWVVAKDKKIGWDDAELTLNDITFELKRICKVRTTRVESALWACNMLNEKGRFWDIKGRNFDQFAKSIAPGKVFDKDYNYFK